ncbi:MAG: polymorphic toxin type 46 domain-containing protein [Flavobacterium sp.]|nr:polymorphic toxin type 46 domain-containing protein [Flavobacterium sp.]
MKETRTADKNGNKQQRGQHKQDTTKKGNAAGKKVSPHHMIPAVHGSQPAFYDGSELMHAKLRNSLQKTGSLQHPDTLKKETDYKKTLGANDLMDYHDLKSGTYIPKTAKERLHMANVGKQNAEIPFKAKEIASGILNRVPEMMRKSAADAVKKPISKQIPAKTQNTVTAPAAITKTAVEEKTAVKDIAAKMPNKVPQQVTKTDLPVLAKKPDVQQPVAKSQPKTLHQPIKTSNQPVNAPTETLVTATQNHDAKQHQPPTGNLKNVKENNEKEVKIVIPKNIGPVIAPRLDAAVDRENSEVAPDPDTTLNIKGLVAMAQEFRDQGKAAQTQATTQKGAITVLNGTVKGLEKDVQQSDADLKTVEKNVTIKENTVALAGKGLATSISRQHKVEQEVGTYQQEYNKNKGKADDLNREAAGLLGGSQKNEDPGEADSGKLTQKLKELSSGAATISQAISRSGNTTQKLSQEAQQAKLQNEKTQKDIAASKQNLAKAKEKITADHQKNKKAKAQLTVLTPQLKKNETETKKLTTEANALLLDSYIIEKDIHKTQENYYKDMATVEGIKSLKQKETEKTQPVASSVSREEKLLTEFAPLASEAAQINYLSKLNDSDLELLRITYDAFIANFDNSESERQAQIQQNAAAIRDNQIGIHDNKRKTALKKPMALATKNLGRITGIKRLWMSVSLALSGIWDSVKSISVVEIIKTLLYPSRWVQAISESISGIWTDLSDWKGFSQDPVGMILQKAAGIANKLLAITGVITGILGVLTVLTAIGSVFTLGGMAPLAIWLGSATITMGTVTFWVGAVALGLNILNGIKNIYDIHTAKTADVMLKNTGELKSDIANSGMAIMAMVGGKGSKKGGAAIKDLAKSSPKTFGKQMFTAMGNSIKGTIVSIPKRIASLFKRETWVRGYQGFKATYGKVKNWTKEKFTKKQTAPVKNDPMRHGPYEEHIGPDRMNEQPLTEKKITETIDDGKHLQDENVPNSKKENKALKEFEEDIAKKEKTGPELAGLSKKAAERKQMCYDFYKEHGMPHDDIKSHLNGINFNKPVKVIRVPPDGLGPEGNELYQFTRQNTEGKALKGNYYTDNPVSKPSELGVADTYEVPDANRNLTDIVKSRKQEKVIFDKSNPMVGLKSTAGPIDDTWSFRDKSIPTPGGAEQIYIPKQ